jgi:anaerobic selenocysteine-containing dehydrogenase
MDHGGCSILAGVEDNVIKKVKGDPEGFLNHGYICPKGLHSAEKLYHPKRLKNPLMRKGKRGEGLWEEISWEKALDIVSRSLISVRQTHGARAVAFCQGMPKGLEHFVLIRLANLFGSPNVVATQDVCHAPRELAGIHTCGFYPVADLGNPTSLVILWGSNITATNEEGEISVRLLEALNRGTEIIIVDPRKTALAKKAKIHIQLRPGTDCALALGFLRTVVEEGIYDRAFVESWTFGFEELCRHLEGFSLKEAEEITGVKAELIREAARLYALSRPAALQWGNAIEHHPSAFDTARALVILMAICGNLDKEGGNVHAQDPRVLGAGRFVRADLLPNKAKEMIGAYYGTIPRLMTVPPVYFRMAVLEERPYPVKAAYMQCTNPLVTYADSTLTLAALEALDFLAVSDIFMTPTASMADIVLPAATHFEFNDIGHYGLGHGYILARPKAVDPPLQCRSDLDILNALGRLMTDPANWYDDPDRILDELLSPSGITYSQFVSMGILKGDERFRKYERERFKTPTGSVELLLSSAGKLGLPPFPRLPENKGSDPAYPLLLTSAKSPYYLHSSYRWIASLNSRESEPAVEINPSRAALLGIDEGDMVLIETASGSIRQRARLSEGIRDDVVCAASGWWSASQEPGDPLDWKSSNYNMLTNTDNPGKEFGTPRLKGIPCRISKL